LGTVLNNIKTVFEVERGVEAALDETLRCRELTAILAKKNPKP